MSGMTDWIVLIIVGIAFPVLMLRVAPPLVWRALRTGELEARGRSYFRAQQPRRFWFGIVFWIAMIALTVFAATAVITHFFRST